MERALRIKREAPEEFERIKRGEQTIEGARRKIVERGGGIQRQDELRKATGFDRLGRRLPSVPVQKRVEACLDSLEIKARKIYEFLSEQEARKHDDYKAWLGRLRKVRLRLSQAINKGQEET